jgi:rare lipoprotein A
MRSHEQQLDQHIHLHRKAGQYDPYHAERAGHYHGRKSVDHSLRQHNDGSISFGSPYGHHDGRLHDGRHHYGTRNDGRHHHRHGDDGISRHGVHMEKGTQISGEMSFYHEGRKTANGERFNPHAETFNKEYGVPEVTGAHRSAAFGTKFLIKDNQGNPKLVVRINDRGPAAWTGRNLDLNQRGAEILGFTRAGHRQYSAEVV